MLIWFTETDVSDVVKLDRNSGNKITGSESARLLKDGRYDP
jgi:hypothetical protein